ncbi:hydroxyethylthiazole kinase [Enterococcus sp. DIV2402]|uniref:Hydroxyethylthiazole kinase n=1 Tax=Candidatus Enterococcus lowellii TaxID=2230877 RepID=A0ABZ2SK80_9ENTE|nr:hydroxyethylthiazole kinase [Enterococcus sp. DIV2402]MBO0465222.1 hydroxyethylthiazole kinase [Enterococcus sp. DIV2402]
MTNWQATLAHYLPLKKAPLVHCITNEITNELLANGLLFVGAKPIMAEDIREFPDLFKSTDGVLLNMGRMSVAREEALVKASKLANKSAKKAVVDIVGAAATPLRFDLAHLLAKQQPSVLKGNISELRAFCGLTSAGRGVDGSAFDQEDTAITELIQALQQQDPEITYLATGKKDIVVKGEQVWLLENGVPELDCFTGTGDLVGALITAFLGAGYEAVEATILGVSYLNCCGERAKEKLVPTVGLADFRHETLNQLSLLSQDITWSQQVKGRKR